MIVLEPGLGRRLQYHDRVKSLKSGYQIFIRVIVMLSGVHWYNGSLARS